LLTPATSTNTAVMLLNLCEFPPSAKPSIRLRSTANSVRAIGCGTFDSVAFHCKFG
jgi:hypothetical protein